MVVVVASTAIAIATDVCPFLDTKEIFDTIKSRYGTKQNDLVLPKGEMRRTININGVSRLSGKGPGRNVRAYKSVIFLPCSSTIRYLKCRFLKPKVVHDPDSPSKCATVERSAAFEIHNHSLLIPTKV